MIAGVVASQITQSVQMATTWTYVGTSGSNNGSYSYMNGGPWCDSSEVVRTKLTSARPPSGYQVGYIMRVSHFQDDLMPCTPDFFYRAD